jgi:hypothetical protein
MHTHHSTYGTMLRSRVLTAVLLGTVSLLSACKPTTEPVERREPTGPDASLIDPNLAQPVNFPAEFDASAYGSIDVLRAARTQYGSAATLTSVSDHLYGWRAVVNGRYYSIDMKRAVADQYGSGYVLGAVGVHLYDWRAVRWSGLNNRVLPVMPVASDLFFNVDAVRTGLANFRSVLITIRNWYDLRMGESFHYTQPLIVPLQSTQTAAEWNYTASMTQLEDHRWDLLNASIVEYQRSYPDPGSALRVMLVPFVGSSPDVWLGAASSGRFAVAPQRATSITCPTSGPLDYRCADATYAIGHELGHTFGLDHSCDVYVKDLRCNNSIMQSGKPWDAILLPGEIATLQPLSFFW